VVGKELLSYVTTNIMRLGNDPELYIRYLIYYCKYQEVIVWTSHVKDPKHFLLPSTNIHHMLTEEQRGTTFQLSYNIIKFIIFIQA
jgi:hypothetical protein